MVRLYSHLMFRGVGHGPRCCCLMMVVVRMFFVVVVELLFEDFGQKPGQLLGVLVSRSVLVCILVEKAEEECISCGENDQEWDEELHVVLISVAVVFLEEY